MKKVFITGACGQVGSHVAEMLLERGDKVLGIDNFATGKRYHLPESHPNLQFIEGTIADRALVEKLFSEFQPDVVVHTAASYKDPEDFYNDTLTNAVGGTNLIRAAKDSKTSRFIYFQTALCYGTKSLENPITLKHPKFPANSSYAISKTVCEDYLEISGLDFVSFRLANVIGPRNVSGPLPIFFQRLSSGKKCFVTTSRRDFVYVKDLARIVLQAIDGKGNGAYHFSSGKDMEIKTLYDAVVKAMKLDPYPAPDIKDLGEDDAKSILLDPSRTFTDFGDIQFTALDELVSAAVDYYSMHGSSGGYTHLKIEEKDK